jgi:hypothetical protein
MDEPGGCEMKGGGEMGIFWTVFATVVSGTLVAVIGQSFTKFIIEPIHDLRKMHGQIGDALIFYARIYNNPGVTTEDEMREASDAFRRLASQLFARLHAIPFYGVWASFRFVPKRHDVANAGGHLIGLSNGIGATGGAERNQKRRVDIERWLDLDTGR